MFDFRYYYRNPVSDYMGMYSQENAEGSGTGKSGSGENGPVSGRRVR